MGVGITLILISIFEIWLLYQLLFGTVLNKEYLLKREWGILWGNIVVMGVLLGINRSLTFFSQGIFVICIVFNCICILFIKKQHKKTVVVIIILYYTVTALVDFFFGFMGMMILKQEFDKVVYTRANSWIECVIFSCSRFFIAIFISMIVKRKYEELYIYEFQDILSVVTIVMCVILRRYQISIVGMIYENRENEAGVIGISLVYILLLVSFGSGLYLKDKILKKEKEFLIMRDEMVTQRFYELESVMEQNRQLSHDLKNHFIILKGYGKEGNCEGICNYIDGLEKEYFSVKVCSWTGNPVADMLIEQKRVLAEKERIAFDIEIIPVEDWPFTDNDTCSLLGNLLDNAIDACKMMMQGDKWISLKIEMQKRFLFIKISNPINEMPVIKNGIPVSTKQNKKKHGYGLKSAERIVNKYNGVITFRIEQNIFEVDISFFVQC